MEFNLVLKTFGERVRMFRKTACLSQENLADLAEMHRTYLSGIERGERNVSLLNIIRLARALEISPSLLIEGIL